MSALIRAIECSETAEAIRLLSNGADPNESDRYGHPALLLAIEDNNVEIVRKLLRRGAKVAVDPLEVIPSLLHPRRFAKRSPGLATIRSCLERSPGKEPIMQLLLRYIDIGKPDKVGGLAHQIWIWAACNGYKTILETLLARQVPVDISPDTLAGVQPPKDFYCDVNDFKRTALQIVSVAGHFDLVNWLLDHGADPNCKQRNPSPLLCLAESIEGECWTQAKEALVSETLVHLLHKGADPNVFTRDGKSFLSELCSGSFRSPGPIVSLAIDREAGKTINSISHKHKRTALHDACRNCSSAELIRTLPSLIRTLINGGANVNMQDAHGHTPLWQLVSNGGPMFNILERGPNLNMLESLDILFEKGAEVDECGEGSTTPLIEAARYRDVEVVKHLIRKQANVNASCGKHYMLLGAIERLFTADQEQILAVLLEYGTSPILPLDFGRQPLLDAINMFGPLRNKKIIELIFRAIQSQHGSDMLRTILQKSTTPLRLDATTTAAFEELGVKVWDRLPTSMDNSNISAIINVRVEPTVIDMIRKSVRTQSKFLEWKENITAANTVSTAAVAGATSAISTGTALTNDTSTGPDEYIKKLQERRAFLLRGRKRENYEPVKIAILDSGINPKHPSSKYIKGYKDFVSASQEYVDCTGHGTDGVLIVNAIIPEAHVYVARVFEEEPTDVETLSAVANAIKYAREHWKVQIIGMSFGFEYDHKDIEREILKARVDDIVVFAAVGNYGNRKAIASPANMDGSVVRIFSTNSFVKYSQVFNPAPLITSKANFGFLGERVTVTNPNGVKETTTGTSIATSIAAATGALLIEFSQREEGRDLSGRLRTVKGMSAVLAKLGQQENDYHLFNPWIKWLDPNDNEAPTEIEKRKFICGTINRELC